MPLRIVVHLLYLLTYVAFLPAQTAGQNARSEPARDHRYHPRLGTIWVGVGYSSGPPIYPYGPYPCYPYSCYPSAPWPPFWGPYAPSGYPGYFPDLTYGSSKGEVKLSIQPENADVYIDGAYAGTAKDLKKMWLESGVYDLSLSSLGRKTFHQRIYVLSGKSLKIKANLVSQQGPETTEEKP